MDVLLRLVDPTVLPTLPRKHQMFTFGSPTLAVVGPQAMMLRWLKIFLTPSGSHPLRREEGTGFFALLRSGNGRIDRLQSILGQEVEAAAEQVRQLDQRDLSRPANERLRSATISQFVEIPPASAEFWVQLATMNGETIDVLLPYASG